MRGYLYHITPYVYYGIVILVKINIALIYHLG
jgi:hypothetical protein